MDAFNQGGPIALVVQNFLSDCLVESSPEKALFVGMVPEPLAPERIITKASNIVHERWSVRASQRRRAPPPSTGRLVPTIPQQPARAPGASLPDAPILRPRSPCLAADSLRRTAGLLRGSWQIERGRLQTFPMRRRPCPRPSPAGPSATDLRPRGPPVHGRTGPRPGPRPRRRRTGDLVAYSHMRSGISFSRPSSSSLSFLRACRRATQVKNRTRISMPTMGMLSGLVTISMK